MLSEYAQQLKRFSRPARIFLLALFFMSISTQLGWLFRSVFLKEAGFSYSFIGKCMSIGTAGGIIINLLLSSRMDRSTLKKYLLASCILIIGSFTGIALFAGNEGGGSVSIFDPKGLTVIAFFLLDGIGSTMLMICISIFYVRHSSPTERPFLFGAGQAVFPAAGIVATMGVMNGMTIFFGENLLAYRWTMAMGAITPIAGFIAFLFIRENPPEKPPSPQNDFSPREKFNLPLALRFWTCEFLISLGAGLTIPFLSLYFWQRFFLKTDSLSGILASAQFIMLFAFLMAPVIAKRWGAIRTILFFQFASIPFFFFLAFTDLLILAILAFLLRQVCMNMVHPIGAHFLLECAPKSQGARFVAGKGLTWQAAWIVSTTLGGYIIEHRPFPGYDGFTTVMLVTIVFYIAGSTLYGIFFRKHPAARREAPSIKPVPNALPGGRKPF